MNRCSTCSKEAHKTYVCRECREKLLCPACYGRYRTKCRTCREPWAGRASQTTGLGGISYELDQLREHVKALEQRLAAIEYLTAKSPTPSKTDT